MECKEIQDLILTDYQDGRFGEDENNIVEEHIATCSLCSEFANSVDKIVTPFKAARPLEPPPELWNTIRTAIAEEKQKKDQPRPGILQWLIDCFIMPKPALALASVLSVLLITSIFFHNGDKTNQNAFNPEEQLDYLVYLLDYETPNNNGQSGDLGTPIEEYFL